MIISANIGILYVLLTWSSLDIDSEAPTTADDLFNPWHYQKSLGQSVPQRQLYSASGSVRVLTCQGSELRISIFTSDELALLTLMSRSDSYIFSP